MGRQSAIRARHLAGAQPIAADRLYHGPEADADHDGERTGGARRELPPAVIPGALLAAADTTAIARRPDEPGFWRIGEGSGAAGAGGQEVLPGGVGGHGEAFGSDRRRQEMTAITQALSAALLEFVWQGLLAAFLLWTTLFVLKNRPARARYLASCVTLAVVATLPVITACLVYTAPSASRAPAGWA